MTGATARRWGALPTKVVMLDLADGMADVTGLDGYVFAFVVVLVDGEPVGTVRVPVEGDRCPADAVAEAVTADLGDDLLRVALLAAMRAAPAGASPDLADLTPFVHRDAPTPTTSMTVAVCTRDRPEQLARCLRALCAPAPPGASRRRRQRAVHRRDRDAGGRPLPRASSTSSKAARSRPRPQPRARAVHDRGPRVHRRRRRPRRAVDGGAGDGVRRGARPGDGDRAGAAVRAGHAGPAACSNASVGSDAGSGAVGRPSHRAMPAAGSASVSGAPAPTWRSAEPRSSASAGSIRPSAPGRRPAAATTTTHSTGCSPPACSCATNRRRSCSTNTAGRWTS